MSRQQRRFKQLASGKISSQTVSIDEIAFETPPHRTIEPNTVETLARVVAESGIKTPINVFFKLGETIPYACDGFELRTAVDLARVKQWMLKDKPVLVRIKLESNRAQQTKALFERLQTKSGRALSLLKKADSIEQLIWLGHHPKGIAQELHTSKGYIRRLLELSKATPETRQLIEQNRLKATTVMNAITKYGASDTERLLKACVAAADELQIKATGEFVESFIKQQGTSETIGIPNLLKSSEEQDKSTPAQTIPVEPARSTGIASEGTETERIELLRQLNELPTEQLLGLVEQLMPSQDSSCEEKK